MNLLQDLYDELYTKDISMAKYKKTVEEFLRGHGVDMYIATLYHIEEGKTLPMASWYTSLTQFKKNMDKSYDQAENSETENITFKKLSEHGYELTYHKLGYADRVLLEKVN